MWNRCRDARPCYRPAGVMRNRRTDLNNTMVAHAELMGAARTVSWRQADVMALPYDDESFDVVVCQFGVMFFPDRVAAYREVRRVLRPGGTFLFNIWNDIEHNEFAAVVTDAVGTLYPEDPPLFLARTPHGYGCHRSRRQRRGLQKVRAVPT